MNNITYHLSSPVMYALGWTVFHALWQGFALVLSTALALYLIRGRSSALRYQVGVLALFSQVLVSAGTFLWYYKPFASTVVHSTTNLPLRSLAVEWKTVTQTLPWHKQIQFLLDDHLGEFVLVYLAGVLLFGIRLAGGWLYLQHIRRSATQPVYGYLADLTNTLRSTLAIRPLVRVCESARIVVPMVVNSVKPVLLLPVGLATHLSVQELEAVLAHELAHIKRHDYAVNLLQSVMEVLYFFHPAIWWLSARIREEREHCCDDLAVRACGNNGRILAQALARVEELRLAQLNQIPTLAMALTQKRQLLLQRVRRVLGVPTRPVVSNGSLIGLTLATLLLVSVSVYAIQQQPKPAKAKPQSTRRLKAGDGTEFTITDDQKIDYVIWKGRKLPAKHVVRLQRQLDQVMGGKLSLDAIPQPDRDILLAIIETKYSSDEGMNALDQWVAKIKHISVVSPDKLDEELAKLIPDTSKDASEKLTTIDYNALVTDALASVPNAPSVADTGIEGYANTTGLAMLRQQDSLADQQELNKGKLALLRAQAQSQQFTVESVERAMERIERQKSVLEQKRFLQTTNQQQTIMKSGLARTDSAQAVLTKQIEAGEVTIRKIETEIEKLNQQLINTHSELEKAQKPLRETEVQIRKLGYTTYVSAWSHAGAQTQFLQGTATSFGPVGPIGPARMRQLASPVAPAQPLRGKAQPSKIPAPPAGFPKLPAKPE